MSFTGSMCMCVCVWGWGILSGHWGAPAAPSCLQWSVASVISSDVLSWQSFCSCWQSVPASHVAGPVIYHTVLFALNIKLAFFYKSIHFSYSNDWVIVLNFYNHILSMTLKYHVPYEFLTFRSFGSMRSMAWWRALAIEISWLRMPSLGMLCM